MLRRFERVASGALVLASVFLFLLLAFPGFIVKAARYDNGQLDFVVGVEGNITIMLPKSDISFMIDASKNEIASEEVEIAIDSNLNHGVYLGMTTAYSHTSVDDVTANGLNSIHNYTIQALDKTVHKSLFPANRWGYSLDGGNYYNRMPAANEGEMAEIFIEDPSNTTVQTVRIGAKADVSQPLDYYYTTINFTAVTNLAARTIDDIIYMQDIDSDIIESMEVDRQYRLRDVRDNKDYWIAKFSDGNVWMTQNLDLDLSSNMTLTPDDSDLNRRWTPSKTKNPVDYNLTESYTMITTNLNYYHRLKQNCTNGVCTYSYDYSRNEAMYGETIDDCLAKHPDDPKFCNHFRKGQEYTPLEALAANTYNDVLYSGHDTISLDESICPKGWKLPTRSFGGDNIIDEFPILSTTQIREYNEYGILSVSGTLERTLAREPYFFNQPYYYTSSVSGDDFIHRRYATYNGISYTSTNVLSNTNDGYIRCMVRPTNTYEISFDLNGGEGLPPEAQKGESWKDTYTFQLNSLSNSPTKQGYNLIGWSTDPNAEYPEVISYGMDNNNNNIFDGNGRRVTSFITVTNHATKLYAVWEDAVKLEFDANGGRFNTTIYSGEYEDRIFLAYSQPLSGTIESEVKTTSSRDCNGNKKTGVEDTTPYCQYNSYNDVWTFGAEYDYVDVTVYYALAGDSTLCVIDGSSNVGTGYCNQSVSGNLANGAFFDASSTYQYVQNYRISNANNSVGIASNTGSSTDGRNSWYGFWVEAKAVKKNTHVQYIRSARRSLTTPTKEGYRFVGWSTNPEATYANWEYNSNLEYTESKRLYAVWKEYPIVNVAFTTDNPDRVHIVAPSIVWNTANTISLEKNNDGQWQYYDADQGRSVIVATASTPGDQFYLASTSISQSYLSYGLASNMDDGDTITIRIYYQGAPISNMQELDRESCALAPLNTTQQMIDVRDNRKYWITKLADGYCWMTQNLDFQFVVGGTTLDPETSSVSTYQTVYIQSSWSSSSSDNNFADGGDYYYLNGVTPTSTAGLSEDAEEWHYHKGSYYNRKLSTMVCPRGWQPGNYKGLYNSYQISQPYALFFTPVTSAPVEAPIYQIVDASTAVTKPDTFSTNINTYTVYWSSSMYQWDIIRESTNNAPLSLYYVGGANISTLRAYSNSTEEFRPAGFVRCMR